MEENSTSEIMLNGVPLNEYTIVHDDSDDASTAAGLFAVRLETACGYTPAVACCTGNPEGRYEILFGKTDRAASAELFVDGDYSFMTSRVKLSGTKLAVGGGGIHSMLRAAEVLINEPVSGDFDRSISLVVNDPAETREAGTDIRIYSYNILGEFRDGIPAAPRAEIIASNILYYMPDVAGLTEHNEPWYRLLPPLIEKDYEYVCRTFPDGRADCSTLIYNKHKLSITDKGFFQYRSNLQSPKSRVVTWAVFYDKALAKSYAVFSTHWDYINDENPEQTASQYSQMEELAAFGVSIRKKYGVELIFTGDFNCGETNPPHYDFMKLTKTSDAKYYSDVKVLSWHRAFHGRMGQPARIEGISADHILFTDGLAATKFSTVVTNEVLYGSDHCPIFADLSFKV